MEAIANFFAGVFTIPVFIPFTVFVVVFFILHWRKKSRKEAVTSAVNVTTFFLISAVALMYDLVKEDTSIGVIWWIVLFFMFTGGGIGWLQYKLKGQVDPAKLIRAVWRLAFVFFTIAYFILFFSGVHHFLQLT